MQLSHALFQLQRAQTCGILHAAIYTAWINSAGVALQAGLQACCHPHVSSPYLSDLLRCLHLAFQGWADYKSLTSCLPIIIYIQDPILALDSKMYAC